MVELCTSHENLPALAANALKVRHKPLEIAGWQGEQKPIAGPTLLLKHRQLLNGLITSHMILPVLMRARPIDLGSDEPSLRTKRELTEITSSQSENSGFAKYIAAACHGHSRSADCVPITTYRPELHYMRERGPKWREKHTRPPG